MGTSGRYESPRQCRNTRLPQILTFKTKTDQKGEPPMRYLEIEAKIAGMAKI